MNLPSSRFLGFVVLGLAALQLLGLLVGRTRDGLDLLVGAVGVVAYTLFGLGLLSPHKVPPSWAFIALGVYGVSVLVVRAAQGRWLEALAYLAILALGALILLRARRRR